MTCPAYHPILGEIRDDNGEWHTGWTHVGHLAETIGTTTADLIRRLVVLGVMEHCGDRHRLTSWARRKGYGAVYWRKAGEGQRVAMDVILPEGMVLVVQNLEATNVPLTEAERLTREGLSLAAVAARLGISKQAVHKRLNALPARLKDWPVVGTWDDEVQSDNDNAVNLSALAS